MSEKEEPVCGKCGGKVELAYVCEIHEDGKIYSCDKCPALLLTGCLTEYGKEGNECTGRIRKVSGEDEGKVRQLMMLVLE